MQSNKVSRFDDITKETLKLIETSVVSVLKTLQRENTLRDGKLQVCPSYTEATTKREMRQIIGLYRSYLICRNSFTLQ